MTIILSVREAAARLGLGPRRLREYIEDGRLPAQRVGRAWIIRESDLARLAVRAKAGRRKKTTRGGKPRP